MLPVSIGSIEPTGNVIDLSGVNFFTFAQIAHVEWLVIGGILALFGIVGIVAYRMLTEIFGANKKK